MEKRREAYPVASRGSHTWAKSWLCPRFIVPPCTECLRVLGTVWGVSPPGSPCCAAGPVCTSRDDGVECHQLGDDDHSPLFPHLHSPLFPHLLEARNLNSRGQQGQVPSGAPEGESFLVFPASGGSGQFLVSLGWWLHHSTLCLCCHEASPGVFCICANSPPVRIPVTGFRATLNQCDLISVTSPKTLFPNKATLTPWGWGLQHTFSGNTVQLTVVSFSCPPALATSGNTSCGHLALFP